MENAKKIMMENSKDNDGKMQKIVMEKCKKIVMENAKDSDGKCKR